MTRIIIILLLAVFSDAFAADRSKIDITAFTLPGGYIKNFPLHEATQRDLLDVLGVPAKVFEFEDSLLWSYEYGEPGSIGTYTFTIENGVITHINYVNQKGRRASSDNPRGKL